MARVDKALAISVALKKNMKKCVKQVCGIDLHIGKMAAVFL